MEKRANFFAKDKLVYLGRVISKDGIHIDPDKARLILKWPTPKNVRDVRGFIGLAQYERKHIKDFSKIASITKLPTARGGYDTIFVVVDRLTKMAHFFPMKKTDGALEVAKVFVKEIF